MYSGSSVRSKTYSSFFRSRPAFIEGGVVPPGVPPPNGGYDGGGGGGGGGGALRMRRRSSSFPLKEDAGYIGYLSGGDAVGSDEEDGVVANIVHRRRRELLGSDVSFSGCLFLIVTLCGLLMLFLFAVSPWGVPPPRRLL